MNRVVPRLICLSFAIALLALWGQGVSWSAAEETSHEATAAERHDSEHADEHGHDDHEAEHEEHPPELPDFISILAYFLAEDYPELAHALHPLRVQIFSILDAIILGTFFVMVGRRLKKIPGRLQGFVELYVELIDNFVCGILGKEIGRRYVPFLGTLAIYIFFMNLSGLVPGFMSPTSVPYQTFALSICVFLYVQFTALKYLGPGGYFFHLAGEPRDAIGYVLSPLFLVLHVMGELIKPLSLGLRLFGNILGEDILLGVFALLGILLTQFIVSFVGIENVYIGLPLHLLLIPIALLGSTIQAVVFMVLSTIYIYLVLPHHEGHEEHAGAH